MAGGYVAALAVLMALWHRRRTGEGQFDRPVAVRVAGGADRPAAAGSVRSTAARRRDGQRARRRRPAPHGVYRCAGDDRWIAISVLDEETWRRFVRVLDDLPWTRDPRFATAAGRLAAVDVLYHHVAEWARDRDADQTMTLLQDAGIAAGRVADAHDLCVRDPQLAARRHFADVPTPEGNVVRLDGPPYVLSETPAYVAGPGPFPGEHTDEVLRHVLGLTANERSALRAEAVVR